MTNEKKTSPLKAIRKHCLECSGGSTKEVTLCTVKHCDLFDFRFGRNPFMSRKLSEEQKAANIARLEEHRKAANKEKPQDISEEKLGCGGL